jgi:tetratricopeptide (TPR) repeat protein
VGWDLLLLRQDLARQAEADPVAGAARLAGLGWDLIRQNRPPQAMLHFNHAWHFDPENGDALAGIGSASASQGASVGEVAELLRRGSAAPRGGAQRHAVFADHLMRLDQYADAAAAAERALAAAPERLTTRLLLADAYYRLEQQDAASAQAVIACPQRGTLTGGARQMADAICKDVLGE